MDSITLSSFKKEDFNLSSIPWLKAFRERSLECYHLLPNEVSSLYNKYTSTTALKPDSIFFDLDYREPSQLILDRFSEVQGISILSVNNKIHTINIPKELKDRDIIIENINDALNKHEELLKDLVYRIDPLEDKFLALENSLFSSGVFIYIPKGLVLEEPITIIHEQGDDGSSSILRNIFYLEESSNATIINELYSNYSGSKQQVLFELNEAYISSNSEFNHIILQSLSEHTLT